jgi:hydroxymethylbilane synthase
MILARAGLQRLGREDKISQTLSGGDWYYAVAQGALAIEMRQNDPELEELAQALDNSEIRLQVEAERAFMRSLEGGCQVPMGIRSSMDEETLTLEGMVCGLEGKPFLTSKVSGKKVDAKKLVQKLVRDLQEDGAEEILSHLRHIVS